ncbi:hypothetical protein [Nisaea sp.]
MPVLVLTLWFFLYRLTSHAIQVPAYGTACLRPGDVWEIVSIR